MRRRVITGMVAGWVLWVALVAMDLAYRDARGQIPQSMRGAVDVVMTGVAFAAWPVGYVGYFFIWGEGPPAWLRHWAPNVVIYLAIYGTLGAMAVAIYQRARIKVQPFK
jgi:hypothetical protein